MPQGTRLDTYKTARQLALLALGFAVGVIASSFIPDKARAFWPFSTNADAATVASFPHQSSSEIYVRAAVNIDPNPNKGLSGIQTSGGRALLAYGGPSGTIADVAGRASSDRISVYVVREGDTLSDIANMFGVSVNTLFWANDLKSVRDVHPGDTLVILPVSGVEHVVKKGDTLKSIAKKYSADADDIAQFNGLDPDAALEVGSTIIVPGGEIVSPAPRSSSPSSVREPYLGGGGSVRPGYYGNTVEGGVITQGIHGWNAVDIGAARGTPIYAAADGIVTVARSNGAWNGGYGNYVVITHGNGTQTLYSHMRNAVVSSGQTVSSGQIIGYVGSTGLSTGAHLHFEVRGAANPFRNCRVGSVCSPQ
ncbi:peptidoglycan DD-metalloendopeptidase family protein [Candidatus Kaiserbacteria bacterium]|nr:peptidoglycan DD-metalloendopeptidase family protein [Candidatus Kaiserbacteria bacterium]